MISSILIGIFQFNDKKCASFWAERRHFIKINVLLRHVNSVGSADIVVKVHAVCIVVVL